MPTPIEKRDIHNPVGGSDSNRTETVAETRPNNGLTPESDIACQQMDIQNWEKDAARLILKVFDGNTGTECTEIILPDSILHTSGHYGLSTAAIPVSTKRPKTWEKDTYTDYKSPKTLNEFPLRINPPLGRTGPNCSLVSKGNSTGNDPNSHRRSRICVPTFCESNNCDRDETTNDLCISNIFAEPDGFPDVKNNMHRHVTIQAKESLDGGQALQYLLQLIDEKLPCPIRSQCSSHFECRCGNALLKYFADHWRKCADKEDVSSEACCTQPCRQKMRNFLMARTDKRDQNGKWIPDHGLIPDILQFLCKLRMRSTEDEGNRRLLDGESSNGFKIHPRACASDDHQITSKLALCASDTPVQISDDTYNPPKQLSISGSPGRVTVETDKAYSIIPKDPVKAEFHFTAFRDEELLFIGSRMGNELGDTNKSDKMGRPKVPHLSPRVEECAEVPVALLLDRSRESGLQLTPTNVLKKICHKGLQGRGQICNLSPMDKSATYRLERVEQPDTQDNQVRIRVHPEKPPSRSAVPQQRKQSGFSVPIKRNRIRHQGMRIADAIPAYRRLLTILFHSTVLGRVASFAQLPIRQPHVAQADHGSFYVGLDKARCFSSEGVLLSWMWNAEEPNHRSHLSKCKRMLEADTPNAQKDCHFSEFSGKRTQKAKPKTLTQGRPMMSEGKTDFHPAGVGGLVNEDNPSLDQVKSIPGSEEDLDFAHPVIQRQDDSPLDSDSKPTKPRVSRKPPEDMRDEKGNAIKNGKGIQLLPDGGKNALAKHTPGRIAFGQSPDKKKWTHDDTITAKAFVCHEKADAANGAPPPAGNDNEGDPDDNVPEDTDPQASAQAPRRILSAVPMPRLEEYEMRLRTFEDAENFWSYLNPGADRLARWGFYYFEQSIICYMCDILHPVIILENENLHSIAFHREDCHFRHIKLCTRCTENLENIGIDGEEGCCACGRTIHMRAFNEMQRAYFEPPSDPEPRAFCNHECIICRREMDHASHHDTCTRCSRQICDDCVMERRFHQC